MIFMVPHPETDSPSRTEHRGVLSDVRRFFLFKPAIPTLVGFASEAEREDYTHRIIQRLGIGVGKYAILNIHRIGIEAPARHVFEELLKWDGTPAYWPNRLVEVERTNDRAEHVEFFLFGKKKSLFGLKNGLFGLNFIPLFQMDLMRFQHVPDAADFDNARYFLYECSGGYPIGICSIYVRSSIADRGEKEQAQAFFVVGFNFYGKENWPRKHVVNKVWEGIHNRVTANVLNQFKRLCEESFREVQTEFPG
jgi:hypothetical protein